MVCATLLSLQAAIAADAEPAVRILTHEPFRPLTETSNTRQKTGTARSLKFDAFGRRFALTLEKNTRLATLVAPTQGPALSLYRGSLDNVPGSWARLSAQADAIRGLIWDGNELYVIDSAAALGKTDVADSDTIIFRLSDTQIDPGMKFCDVDTSSAKTAYTALIKELKNSPVIRRAPGASLRLELSVIGDALLRARYSDDQQALDAILIRLNNVDGIYTSQLGVELQATTVNLNDEIAAQLPAATSANDLVAALSQLRGRTPSLNARGLTHLFTGRDLDGSTVGTAYTGGLCSKTYGAGLTQVSGSVGIDSLIAAHEIGHNFGAEHDGSGVCASTPVNQYIMSPQVTASATSFSQCSLDAIRPVMQSASCLMPMSAPDLAVDADLGTRTVALNTPFEWPITVTNQGGSTAINAKIVVLVPPVITVDNMDILGGSCTSGAGVISCLLGDIAAAGSRVIRLTFRSDVIGTNSVGARVSAASNDNHNNDVGDGTLVITPAIDLAVALNATPSTLTVGSTTTLSYTAQNLSTIDATSVVMELALSGGVTAMATSGAMTCDIGDGKTVRCTEPLVAAGQTLSGPVTLSATSAGAAAVQASIRADSIDPQTANNTDSQLITVTQPEAARRGSRGGGGTLGFGSLLGLFGLLAVRRRSA
jgi:hypothetical protein